MNAVDATEPQRDDESPASRGDLRRLERRINEQFAELRDYFDAAIENVVDALKGANADDLSLLHDARRNHEERLDVLEQRRGLRPPMGN